MTSVCLTHGTTRPMTLARSVMARAATCVTGRWLTTGTGLLIREYEEER